jgi:hypothetical protein
MRVRWLSIVFSLRQRRVAISELVEPCATMTATCHSVAVRLSPIRAWKGDGAEPRSATVRPAAVTT